jgi:hypothetical protein
MVHSWLEVQIIWGHEKLVKNKIVRKISNCDQISFHTLAVWGVKALLITQKLQRVLAWAFRIPHDINGYWHDQKMMAISGPKLQVLNFFQFAFRNIVRMLLHCKQSFPKRKNCAENDYSSGINLKVLKPKTVSELDISISLIFWECVNDRGIP